MKMQQSEVYKVALEVAEVVVKKYPAINRVELAQKLTALAAHESTFNTTARNKNSTARGITQVLIATQRYIEQIHRLPYASSLLTTKKYPKVKAGTYEAIFDPYYCLLLSGLYLCYHMKKTKNWDKALAAYNQGNASDAAVSRAKGYVAKVNGYFRQYFG